MRVSKLKKKLAYPYKDHIAYRVTVRPGYLDWATCTEIFVGDLHSVTTQTGSLAWVMKIIILKC